jgi:hypothetical protein
LGAVAAEAGDYSVEEQDEWNYRKYVGEEQARPAKGTNPRSEEEGEQRPKKHERDSRGGAAGDFENADGLAGVHGILQDGAGFGGLEMVEGSEHGAEAAEFGRDSGRVHRTRMERDVILRSGTGGLEGVEIWIFIGEQDLQGSWRDVLQPAREVEPGASASGAHINHGGAAGGLQRGLQERGDGGVGGEAIHAVLQGVCDFIAQKRGEPGLFVEFDKLEAAHGDWACEKYEATRAGAANGLVWGKRQRLVASDQWLEAASKFEQKREHSQEWLRHG